MDELSQVFAALADPTRRDMVTRLAAGDATANQLAEPYRMSLQAVYKHLKVLEKAGVVSRPPGPQPRSVRLEAEVFVAVVPRRGVVVRQLSEGDVAELYDVREALEVLACRRAAERAGKTGLNRLERILDQIRKAVQASDLRAAGAANEAFHDQIIALARNKLLASMLEPLQGRLHWLFRQHDNPAELYREHQQLYEAIASGDPDRAAQQALEHVRVNRELALRLLFGGAPEQPSAG